MRGRNVHRGAAGGADKVLGGAFWHYAGYYLEEMNARHPSQKRGFAEHRRFPAGKCTFPTSKHVGLCEKVMVFLALGAEGSRSALLALWRFTGHTLGTLGLLPHLLDLLHLGHLLLLLNLFPHCSLLLKPHKFFLAEFWFWFDVWCYLFRVSRYKIFSFFYKCCWLSNLLCFPGYVCCNSGNNYFRSGSRKIKVF